MLSYFQKPKTNPSRTGVLFVCMGNICRSPMAEGILRRMLRERDLENRFEVDSVGTGDWHRGESADLRAQHVLKLHNANFRHSARKIEAEDLERFERIFVMDFDSLYALERRFPQRKGRFELLMHQVVHAPRLHSFNPSLEVPDPYYGDLSDFEQVYQMLEEALGIFLSSQTLAGLPDYYQPVQT